MVRLALRYPAAGMCECAADSFRASGLLRIRVSICLSFSMSLSLVGWFGQLMLLFVDEGCVCCVVYVVCVVCVCVCVC